MEVVKVVIEEVENGVTTDKFETSNQSRSSEY